MSRQPKDKTKRIDLKASTADEISLQMASAKLGTETVTSTIFESVKQQAERVEYGCDRISIRRTLENIEYGRANLQNFLDEFLNESGQSLTFIELQSIFAPIGKLGSQGLFEAAISEMILTKAHRALQEKHPDMIVSSENVPPHNLQNLFSLASKLDYIPEIKFGQRPVIFWQCYDLSEGRIIVIQDQVDRLTDTFRFVASSAEQLKRLAVVETLCQAMNEILKDPSVTQEAIYQLAYFDQELKRFVPSGAYISVNPTAVHPLTFLNT